MFRLSPDRALVATVDFFTPIVDDPAAWGAIAAANALSDIYAMGATPLFALNLVGWPRDRVPFEVLGEVLRGAAEVAARARCLQLGGHSIDAVEPTFGMAVIGEVHPDRMLTNAGASAGDLLVLTKPLGTGIMATALKRDALLEPGMAEAVRSMTTLNDGAARAALRSQPVRACTFRHRHPRGNAGTDPGHRRSRAGVSDGVTRFAGRRLLRSGGHQRVRAGPSLGRSHDLGQAE